MQMREFPIENFSMNSDFWNTFYELVRDVVLPYQEQILGDDIDGIEKSHAFENFKIAAGEAQGEFYGMVFQDSDVAKWLEAVAYSLASNPDEELEKRADRIIETIGKAQCPDGYLNTYFTIKEPQRRWQNLRECHELYCAGHMMEAAAAYYFATGKTSLLDIMNKMAEHIYDRFIIKGSGFPGHQEIELGLMRMYRAVGSKRYLDLARHFIDERGKNPNFFEEEAINIGWSHWNGTTDNKYNQSHLPVREQREAVGHSVRAVYMYAAMADIAKETDDKALLEACSALWDNITGKKLYLTGAIGSTVEGEAFTIDYDLPNDTVYGETCASIGLVFFAKKMLDIHPSNKYSDVMEQALYNNILSGMQLDGKRFFYVNPLEVNPGVSGVLYGYKHVLPERPSWYGCACCPPNLARLIMSLGRYAWSEAPGVVYSHLYVGGTAKFTLNNALEINLETDYPWDGNIKYTIIPKEKDTRFSLAVRIPGWEKHAELLVNGQKTEPALKDGYAYTDRTWQTGDTVELRLALPVRWIYANTAVRADSGCTALMRGPVVYCFEEADNGAELQALRIPRGAEVRVLPYDRRLLSGVVPLSVCGVRTKSGDSLYSESPPEQISQQLLAVPYYAWGNRGLNQMRVWMQEI